MTWTVGDAREGFGLEARADAIAGESAQIVFVGIGGAQDTFADANVTNKRPVPKLDQNGTPLDSFQNPYFVSQQPGTNTSNWVRRRVPSEPLTEVYFSNNSGDNWFQFATANFKFAGEVRTVGPVAWLPVFTGGINNEIGLVPMSTSIPLGLPPPVYDDSDVVHLPGRGSLGQRFTEFDKHAIYGVNPTNWAYVIAPDIVANDVKVTRDGGKTWKTSPGLTAEVLRGGAVRMWGGKADFIQVTEIAFDPYNPRRILVGTRDSGIACSADDGATWRTICDSDKILYITGFHFHPSGAVYISGYGRGLWYMDPGGSGCSYDFPWDVKPIVDVSGTDVGALARDAPPPIPRGVAAPDRPKLFVTFQEPRRKPEGERLAIAGRGFTPGQDIILRCREFERLQTRVRADGNGQFTTTLALPESFPHGTFTLEAHSAAGKLTASEFDKPFSDEELDKRDRVVDRHPPKRRR